MKPGNISKEQHSSKSQYTSRIVANPPSTKNNSKFVYSKRGSSSDQARESQRYNSNKINPNNLMTQSTNNSPLNNGIKS